MLDIDTQRVADPSLFSLQLVAVISCRPWPCACAGDDLIWVVTIVGDCSAVYPAGIDPFMALSTGDYGKMSSWTQANSIGLLLLIVSQTVTSSGKASSVNAARSEATDYSGVVDNLPWGFVVNRQKQTSESKQLQHIRYDFKSVHPMRKTVKKRVYLKAWLELTRFESTQAANTEMRQWQARAHPDMGLSYEWDHMVINKDQLYHLHAGCVFSEENFSQMRRNLEKMIGMDVRATGLTCRCGGGCSDLHALFFDNQELKHE